MDFTLLFNEQILIYFKMVDIDLYNYIVINYTIHISLCYKYAADF